jgi:hypothetical protein
MSSADELLRSALHTEAERLAMEGGRIDEAVAVLREMAGGREDLVAEAAGILGGAWTMRAEIEEGWAPIGAGLLILAGPNRDQLQHWMDTGRERAGQAGLQARGPDKHRGP